MVKLLFCKTQKLENVFKVHDWEGEFHIPFVVHDLRGIEINAEYSIPILSPYRDFSNFWVLKLSVLPKKKDISVVSIGHILLIPQPAKCEKNFLTLPVEF